MIFMEKKKRFSLFNIKHAEMYKVYKEIPLDELLGITYKMKKKEKLESN